MLEHVKWHELEDDNAGTINSLIDSINELLNIVISLNNRIEKLEEKFKNENTIHKV